MDKGEQHLHNQKKYKQRRRDLRNHGTPAEATLWTMLKKRQLQGRKFRRQHSVGPYILDFYCPAEKLAVELDGAPHDDPFRATYDAERETYLRQHGIRVVRYENRRVFEEPEAVLEAIAASFHAPQAPSTVEHAPQSVKVVSPRNNG